MSKTIEELSKEVAEQLFIIQNKERELKTVIDEIARHQEEVKFLEDSSRKLKGEISSIRYIIAEKITKEESEQVVKIK